MCFSVVKRRFTKRCEKKDVPAGRNRLRMILASQDGMGVVEVILIIVEICIWNIYVYHVFDYRYIEEFITENTGRDYYMYLRQ